MEKVNLTEKFDLFDEYWSPKIVGELNGQHVKLVKPKGEFVWHHHEAEDELFLVIKGQLVIKLREKDITLKEGEFVIVPRGVEHKPIAEEGAHVLLFEPKSTLNTGNVRNERTIEELGTVEGTQEIEKGKNESGSKSKPSGNHHSFETIPDSLRFIIELMSSSSTRFNSVENDPDAAERQLIEQLLPCFNEALNRRPTPLPSPYSSPSAAGRHPKSIKTMIHDAARACQLEDSVKLWGQGDRQ